jgi:amidase
MRGVVETVRLTTTGEASAREVLEESIARIDELNPRLNAFTRILAEEARAEAAERDAALARGEAPGPLHGVPVAIKEEIDVAGCVTTYGGRANSAPAAADSEVVRRLRAAGASIDERWLADRSPLADLLRRDPGMREALASGAT